MDVIESFDATTTASPQPAELLIEEVRRQTRRRHRRNAAAVASVLVVAGALVAILLPGNPHAVNAGGGTATQVGTGTDQGKSALLTFAAATPLSGGYKSLAVWNESLSLEAKGGSSEETRVRNVTVSPSGRQFDRTTYTTMEIKGVEYTPPLNSSGIVAGRWIAATPPLSTDSDFYPGLFVKNRDALQYLKAVSLTPVTLVGHSKIGGVAATEYEATVSELKLLAIDQPSTARSLLQLLFTRALPDGAENLVLSHPMELWVGRAGEAIKAATLSVQQVSSEFTTVDGVTKPVTNWTTAWTLELSNVVTPVQIKPPTGKIRFERAAEANAWISGSILVKGPNGTRESQSGAAIITSGQYPSSIQTLVAVNPNGTYALPSGAPFQGVAQLVSLSATFYAGGSKRLNCGAIAPVRSNATNVDFVCSES